MKKYGIEHEAIAVHFSTCVTRDSGHYPPCPHAGYMKQILERKAFGVIEGSYEAGR